MRQMVWGLRNCIGSLARTRRSVSTTLVVVIVLCAAGVVSPVPERTQLANAASSGLTPCSTSDLREVISTSQQSYGPGTLVVMTSSVRNVSNKICSVGVGPTSPSFTVMNSKGVVVWNNCYANGRPGACALYLVAHSLKPGITLATIVEWNQRSGQPPIRVPTGSYRLTTLFSGVAGNHTARFQLTSAAAPHSITATQADSGRRFSLHKGARLFVQLTGPAIYTWTDPISSDATVLERTASSSGNIATATFVATSVGQVRVTAVDNPNCYPQCLPPSRLFELTVSVIT